MADALRNVRRLCGYAVPMTACISECRSGGAEIGGRKPLRFGTTITPGATFWKIH